MAGFSAFKRMDLRQNGGTIPLSDARMSVSFDLTRFAAEELTTCPAGRIVWLTTPHERALHSMLMLTPSRANEMLAVDLEGAEAFRIREGRMPNVGAESVIPLTTEPLTIALPTTPRTTGDNEMIGAMALNRGGAFLIARRRDAAGFEGTRYVSMRDWTVHPHLPPDRSTIFPVWRFTTSEATVSDRRVIYAHGLWIA